MQEVPMRDFTGRDGRRSCSVHGEKFDKDHCFCCLGYKVSLKGALITCYLFNNLKKVTWAQLSYGHISERDRVKVGLLECAHCNVHRGAL